MDELTARSRVDEADTWTRQEFDALQAELDAMGCSVTPLARAGVSYRLGGAVILRIFPRETYLALGFPNRLRADVEVLTGGLRSQRSETWLNYGPGVCNRDAVTALLARSADPGANEQPSEARTHTTVRTTSPPAPDRDEQDLRFLLDLITAFSRYAAGRSRTPPIKALREAIWFHWEAPRLPDGGKYSPRFPHSPAARGLRAAGIRTDLISEHLLPIKVLIHELIAEPPPGTGELRDRLDRDLAHVVITRDEDTRLTRAGVASSVPDRSDPWSRYRQAGMDPEDFRPLA